MTSSSRLTEFYRSSRLNKARVKSLLNEVELLISLNQIGDAEEWIREAKTIANKIGELEFGKKIKKVEILCRSKVLAFGESNKASQTREGSFLEPTGLVLIGEQDSELNFMSRFQDHAIAFQIAIACLPPENHGELHPDVVGLYSGIVRKFGHSDSKAIQARKMLMTARVEYELGNFTDACATVENAIRVFDEIESKQDQWLARRLQLWCLSEIEDTPKVQMKELDNELVHRMEEIANTLTVEMRAAYLLDKWTEIESIIAAEFDELQSKRFFERFHRGYRSKKAAYQNRVQNYKVDLSTRYLKTESEVRSATPKKSPWPGIWHNWRIANVSFLVLPDRILVTFRTIFGTKFHQQPFKRVGLRKLIGELGEWDSSPVYKKAAKEIGEKLRLSELKKLLAWQPISSIQIEADDCLHGLPFDWIFRQANISQRLFFHSGERTRKRTAVKQVLGVGVQISPPGERPSPLPNAIAETESIGEISRKNKIPFVGLYSIDNNLGGDGTELIGNRGEATKASVISQMQRAQYINLACHGQFQPDEAENCCLLLMSEEKGLERISLVDLASLDLRHVEHTTLSSCYGADNFVLPGRWVISLSETLVKCGVGSVLSCLWRVADDTGAKFAALFFEKSFTMPRSKALKETQKEIEAASETSSPFFWAGYKLSGPNCHQRIR